MNGVTQTETDRAEEYRFEAFLRALYVGRRNKQFNKRHPLWKTFAKTRFFLDYLYEQYAMYAERQDARDAFARAIKSPEIQQQLRGVSPATKMQLVEGTLNLRDVIPSLAEAAAMAGM